MHTQFTVKVLSQYSRCIKISINDTNQWTVYCKNGITVLEHQFEKFLPATWPIFIITHLQERLHGICS